MKIFYEVFLIIKNSWKIFMNINKICCAEQKVFMNIFYYAEQYKFYN